MLIGGTIRATSRLHERRRLLQIFCVATIALIGFCLRIDACWSRDANSLLEFSGPSSPAIIAGMRTLSIMRRSSSQLCVTPKAPIWRSPDS